MNTKAQRTIQAWEREGNHSPIATRISTKKSRPRKADHGHTITYVETFQDKTDFTRAFRFTCQCGKVFTSTDHGGIIRRAIKHARVSN